MAALSESRLWKPESILCALDINKYADTAWPVLNRQTWTSVSFPTLQMMADAQKSMQLLKEHPPSPNVLPPVYAPHWELNPDDSSKCNLCESKTVGTLVILVWFDAPSGGILSLAKCIGFSFSFPVCFWLYQKKALRKGHGRSSAASSGESQLRLGAGKPLLSHCCSSILGG